LESLLDHPPADDRAAAAAAGLDTTAIYLQYGALVWATLQRLGVRENELDDLFQEVFVVVHQRHASYSGAGALASWLFGICVRVVAAHRRRAYVRRERVVDEMPTAWEDGRAPAGSPEEHAATGEGRATLRLLLDEMDLEKRAVFVMFELEAIPCDQIASLLGVPVGTVYSRLHAARRAFAQALARLNARRNGTR
jgi:RNA polymerase sigma-70 factor (ECF subfamily)